MRPKHLSKVYAEYIKEVQKNPDVKMVVLEEYSTIGYDPTYTRVVREVPAWLLNTKGIRTILKGIDMPDSTLGLCSKVGLYQDNHLVLLDIDYSKLSVDVPKADTYIAEIVQVLIEVFNQEKVYIIKSSSNGVHLAGTTPVPWTTYSNILTAFNGVDRRYAFMSGQRRYGTVRIANCNNKPFVPALIGIVSK